MKSLILIMILAVSSCGKHKDNGYGCISKETAILTCRADAGLKYQNPTLESYSKTLCESLYPADICYQELNHKERL